MKKIITIFLVSGILSTATVFAQVSGSSVKVKDFGGLFDLLTSIGDKVIYLLVALAVIYIVWNVVQYVIHGSDATKKGEAGMNILWGIVGLFIIVSIWGLVNILTNTFSTDNTRPKLPNADFTTNSNNNSGTI